jgi:hypothetical protein
MKYKTGLIISFLCFLPGWYAVVAWTIDDIRTTYQGWEQSLDAKNQLFPLFGFSMQTKILILLFLSVAGIICGLNTERGNNKKAKRTRTLILIPGVLLIGMLVFALL